MRRQFIPVVMSARRVTRTLGDHARVLPDQVRDTDPFISSFTAVGELPGYHSNVMIHLFLHTPGGELPGSSHQGEGHHSFHRASGCHTEAAKAQIKHYLDSSYIEGMQDIRMRAKTSWDQWERRHREITGRGDIPRSVGKGDIPRSVGNETSRDQWERSATLCSNETFDHQSPKWKQTSKWKRRIRNFWQLSMLDCQYVLDVLSELSIVLHHNYKGNFT